jgi:hypothetical protein
MKTKRGLLWCTMFLAVCLFGHSLALADGAAPAVGGATSMPLTLPSGWPGLVAVILIGGSWALRKWSGIPFFHTTGGAALNGALTTVIPTVMQAVLSHGLDAKTLQTALFTGLFAFWAQDNPSNSSDEQKQQVAAMRLANGAAPPPPPPITKAVALLPFIFITMALSSCAHLTPAERAYGAAYGACMEAKGIAAAPGVGAEVWTDLSHGTNTATIVAQLEALAAKAGVDAVTCASQSWLQPAAGAQLSEKNPAGVAAGNAFLKAHGGG